jgi:hypothetical protein
MVYTDRSFVSGLNDYRLEPAVISLQPESAVVSGLLQYLWSNWDDHMDVCILKYRCSRLGRLPGNVRFVLLGNTVSSPFDI